MISPYFKKTAPRTEYVLHKLIYNATTNNDVIRIPRIYDYDEGNDALTMQNIPNVSIADYYGEYWEDIPCKIQQTIKVIIKVLFLKGYVYPDITGYNFIEFDNHIWLVDFGHAFVFTGDKQLLNDVQLQHYAFVEQFIENEELGWNPDFQ